MKTRTSKRHYFRGIFWGYVKAALRNYLKGPNAQPGRQSEMARALGLQPSQLHRFSCPRCEHDQEPTFSVGMAVLAYLYLKQAMPPVSEFPFPPSVSAATTPPRVAKLWNELNRTKRKRS
jgi:hypothetical protein